MLVDALATAQRATSTRAALPVLSGLRLSLTGNQLRLTGSDLDLTITTRSRSRARPTASRSCRRSSPSTSCDPSRVVPSTSRPTGDEARISGGRSNFRLHSIPADEFPNLVDPEGEQIVMQAADLAEGLKQVVRAASTDESRPILTGVMLAAEGHGLRMVSTDSYRLAVRDLPGTAALREGQTVLVPSRALNELARALADDTDVTLVLGERDASFQVGPLHLTTRLIDGEFPNYRGLIPTGQPNRSARGSPRAVGRRSSCPVDGPREQPCRLTMTTDLLELRAVTLDVGEASEQIDASYDGEELAVAFNPEYLVDGLEVTPGDEVSLETVDSLKPALIRPIGSEDFLYLLMPVRVS